MTTSRLHRFMLFLLFLEDLRSSQAALRGQMTNVADYLPDLVFFQNSLPGRHAGGIDSVYENPVQLAVGVSLDFSSAQIRHWGRHLLRERHAGVLSIKAVTYLAVMAKVFFAFVDARLIVGDGILIVLSPDGDFPFYFVHDSRLY